MIAHRPVILLLAVALATPLGACAPDARDGEVPDADMPHPAGPDDASSPPTALDTTPSPPTATDTSPLPPTAPATMVVPVVFTRDEQPVTVEREVPHANDRLRAALEALVRGPSPAERDAGIHSWFSSETSGIVREVTVDAGGGAVVDFEDFRPLIPGASSSFGSQMLLAELLGTVFAAEGVTSVELRIDGSCDDFWNFLQRSCEIVEAPAAPTDPAAA